MKTRLNVLYLFLTFTLKLIFLNAALDCFDSTLPKLTLAQKNSILQ